ncbi:MAG: TIGR04282 family arsenosugar biosynthesis glycosyltransferase [Candidatus Hodarchaeales archaeon]
MKTRLQNPLLPPDFSTQLQNAMLLDTIKGLKSISEKIVPVITYHPENKRNIFEKLIIDPLNQDDSKFISSLQFVPQSGERFSDRFKNAIKYVFHDLKLESMIIIGSDTPHIQPSLLQTVIRLLQSNPRNSALGPSQEGGFYLLGHNKPYHEEIGTIFHTKGLYQELGNAMDLLLSVSNVHILPEVTDVDHFEDLTIVRSIINLLSLNFRKGKDVYLPEHTFNLINSLNDNIWNS